MDAKTASDAAEAATTSGDAAMYQAQAEAAQGRAETARDSAMSFAGMVANIKQMMDDDANEAQMLADAKGAAMTAATDARTAATEAQTAADKVAEITSPTSEQAMAAQEAADAAATAATAAETASAAAEAAEDSATAMTAQMDAETAKKTAVEERGKAVEFQRVAQIASDAVAEAQEQIDILAARTVASVQAQDALNHYMAAMGKATDARAQAGTARAAAERAARARTNEPKADAQATAAETAATEAEAARDRAETAKDDAQAAATSAVGADNSDDAEMYRDQAIAANVVATENHTGMTGAGMAYMRAKDAAENAEMYANRHVVGLLMMANAYHITTAADPDANLDETELELIRKNKADHVEAVNTAVKTAADDTTDTSRHGGGDVTATHPYGDEGDGVPAISVTPEGGDPAALVHATPDADNPVTANFTLGRGLGDFPHEKYLTGRDSDGDNTGTRVILFTDLEQATAPKDGTSDALDNQAVPGSSRVEITANPTGDGAAGPGNTSPRMFNRKL